MIKKAEELIDELKQKIADASQKLEEYFKQLQDVMNKVIEKSKEEFQKYVDEAEKVIEEWKKKAEEAGVDIQECYVQQEDELKKLPEKFLQYEISCITNEIQSGMDLIKSSEQLVEDVSKDITDIVAKLQNCPNQGLAGAVNCVKDVLKTLTDIASKVRYTKTISCNQYRTGCPIVILNRYNY